MQNSKNEAGAEVQESTEADVTTSSSHNAKPHVVGSPSLSEQHEIKFRGLTETNKWIYGFFFKTEVGCFVGEYNDEVSVFPKSVGQYTGLKDKNGKEIYEGDLIGIYEKDSPQSVEFVKGKFMVNGGKLIFSGTSDGYADLYLFNSHVEVVGNVFENHELLGSVQ